MIRGTQAWLDSWDNRVEQVQRGEAVVRELELSVSHERERLRAHNEMSSKVRGCVRAACLLLPDDCNAPRPRQRRRK